MSSTMRFTSGKISESIAKMPMAVVVIPFAIGIFFANRVLCPFWLLLALGIASLIGAIALERVWRNLALFTLVFTLGATIQSASHREDIPYNQPLEMALHIERTSVLRGGYTSTEARIVECENRGIEGLNVAVWGDSLLRFNAGDRLCLTTPIRPFRAKRKEYARLMYHRGVVGTISLNHRATYTYIPTERRTLQDWAVERLRSAMEEGDARAVVLAMTTGERSEIDEELRQSYSASGTSHLLAVSGLHIGIAFMLINLLLFPLGLLRYGNVLRSLLAIALIWCYVWLCGLSPSAVRAATMFSMLQISLSSLREYSSINILAGTAFAMLLFDSNLLFDISFQLSFIAVAGIILWAMPLYRLCATRYKVANMLIGILLVGVASTFATMPLVAHTFSIVSVVGIVINPVVIVLANIIVLAGLLALLYPPLAVVAWWGAEVQNHIIGLAESLSLGHFDTSLSEGWMCAIYLLFGVGTILFLSLSKERRVAKIEE